MAGSSTVFAALNVVEIHSSQSSEYLGYSRGFTGGGELFLECHLICLKPASSIADSTIPWLTYQGRFIPA
jgi:hypothetical protein